MGTTSNRALRYPSGSSTIQVPADIKALADDVDAQLGPDVGLQHNVGLTLSASSGFGSLDYSWQVRNGWMSLLVAVVRTGATITAASNGNIGNTQMVALGSRRPPTQVPTLAYLVTAGVGGAAVLYPTGELYLLSIQPSGTVSAGNTIRCYFTYPA